MRFVQDDFKKTANQSDYSSTGYDEGHLAPAGDFANDYTNEELTFRFYNCVPQNPHLNRGIWKSYESQIRSLSQSDSLLIICGSIFGKKKLPKSKVYIPDYCWKVCQSLTDKKILFCFIVSNDDKAILKETTLKEIQKLIGYNLNIKK
jgi:endonuclease G